MSFDSAVDALFSSPLFNVTLTLLAFQVGLICYEKVGRKAWMHPVVMGTVIIVGFILLTPHEYPTYFKNNELLLFFLGPATVALAVPLRNELKTLRGIAVPALVIIALGSVIAPLTALGAAWLFGADEQVLVSLLAKSVTSPIAIGVTENLGGLVSLITAVTLFTGIAGALMGPTIFKIAGLTDDRLQGILLGVLAHGVGTARGFEISVRCGALAGLGMGLTGTFSAFMLPYLKIVLFG
ncbi:LrgB family protein [Sessilibacter sp. MAH2]